MATRRELFSDILWSLVAVAIVVGGVIGFRVLGALREPVAATPPERTVPPVETAALERWRAPLPVAGEGYVRAAREVALAAEAPGRIVELAPAVVGHGAVRAGETLARLDDRSARAALERARADIDSTRARIELNATQLERAESLRRRGVISQEELDRRLAEEAELSAALASLESARESAEIALDATRVTAPFDGRVLAHAVEVGDVVGAGQSIATVFTPDALEVTLPLEESRAALIPGLFEGGSAPASVTTRFAGSAWRFGGEVSRVGAALDARTRTLDVTVALDAGTPPEPVDGSRPPSAGTPPALVNAWAEVVIEGEAPGEVYAVPSATVREGDTLWLVTGAPDEDIDVRGTARVAAASADSTEGGRSAGATDDDGARAADDIAARNAVGTGREPGAAEVVGERTAGGGATVTGRVRRDDGGEGGDTRLAIVPIDIVHVENGTSYVAFAEPPSADARFVTSVLAAPVDGMPVAPIASGVDGEEDARGDAADGKRAAITFGAALGRRVADGAGASGAGGASVEGASR